MFEAAQMVCAVHPATCQEVKSPGSVVGGDSDIYAG